MCSNGTLCVSEKSSTTRSCSSMIVKHRAGSIMGWKCVSSRKRFSQFENVDGANCTILEENRLGSMFTFWWEKSLEHSPKAATEESGSDQWATSGPLMTYGP